MLCKMMNRKLFILPFLSLLMLWMSFIIVFADLMKQTTDFEALPLTSEMAVSLLQSQATSGGVKRPVDDMLLDSMCVVGGGGGHDDDVKSPVSVVTQHHHSPYKLSSSFLSPVAMTTTSTSMQPGNNSDDDMPTLKRAKLEHHDDVDAMVPDRSTNRTSPEKIGSGGGGGVAGDLLRRSIGLPSPRGALPSTWLESAPSPLRHSDSAMTAAAAYAMTSPARGVNAGSSEKHASPLGGGGDLMTSSPPRLPPVLPLRAPLPAHVISSPSRSSDGETSLENTDPNTLPPDDEGHEVRRGFTCGRWGGGGGVYL